MKSVRPNTDDWHQYYAAPGIMTNPEEYRQLFNGLPTDIPALCRVVQGLILHIHWAEKYGVKLTEQLKQDSNLRRVDRQLSRIRELDGSPLTCQRPYDKRIGGTCRDFAVLLCSILKYQGVPARARCGFGTYFTPNRYEDHWICEYWSADEERWVAVDAQLDQFQHKALGITFNPLDMPEGLFLRAGKAWQLCRKGRVDPERFGIFDCHGMWFIAGNLVRDLLSLNKIELLPWDEWGLMPRPELQDIPRPEMEMFDLFATLTLSGNEAFTKVRSRFESTEGLLPPPGWEP